MLWFLPNWHRIIHNVWLILTLHNDIIRLFLSILCKLNYSSMHSVCGIRLAISKTSTHPLTSTFGGVLIIDSAPKSLYTFTLGPIDTLTNVHFYQLTLLPMYTFTNWHFYQCTLLPMYTRDSNNCSIRSPNSFIPPLCSTRSSGRSSESFPSLHPIVKYKHELENLQQFPVYLVLTG